MEKFIRLIDSLTDKLGIALYWLCLPMMLTTCLVVLLRYVFHAGNIIFIQEAIIYMHATIFMLASGWALKRNGHVRVDVFYRKFSARKKAWIDSLGVLIFLLPLCALILFSSLGFVSLSWSIFESSGDAGGIPLVYLFKTLIPLFAIVLALQGIAELLRNVLFLCGITDHLINQTETHAKANTGTIDFKGGNEL